MNCVKYETFFNKAAKIIAFLQSLHMQRVCGLLQVKCYPHFEELKILWGEN